MPAWRFRRCPGCGVVQAASKFEVTGSHRPGFTSIPRGRRCPGCGYEAPTHRFVVVREKRAAGVATV